MRLRCLHCFDTGMVCEEHPEFPWEDHSGPVEGHAHCGEGGMSCPACCSEIPQDGTASIAEAFTPAWKRATEGQWL